MPNHVKSRLVITAKTENELKEFLQKIKSKNEKNADSVFDFNAIIPMPEEIRNTESSKKVDNAICYFLNKEGRSDERTIDKQLINRIDSKEENVRTEYYELGKHYVGLYEKYGYKDWYDWSRANWGTKWNAYDTCYEYVGKREACILFTTAWCDVTELIQELAKQNPNIAFNYKCASEDVGTCCVNAYTSDDKGGVYVNMPTDNSEEAIKIYCECWEEDFDNFYIGEDGYWRNRVWEIEDYE